MNFNRIDDMRKEGFEGFVPICDLQALDCRDVPDSPGVYLVLRTTTSPPEFILEGTGGHFKGRNPNKAIACLKDRWVDGTVVTYVGKAGGLGRATLLTRLRQFTRFGLGKNVGHWGGRYIRQLRDSRDLLVCWKVTGNLVPRDVEKELIGAFTKRHSKPPLANLRR